MEQKASETMDDKDLLVAFLGPSIPKEAWDHKAHVKVAYLLLKESGLYKAKEQMKQGLLHFLKVNEIPTTPEQGYHETLTQAWLQLVHTTMAESGPYESAEHFCEAQDQLLAKRAMLFFYSRDTIMSLEAREAFVAPDLAPLPLPRNPNTGCYWSPPKKKARGFADRHHGEQMYGEEPYTAHLDAVATLCAPYGEEAVMLAYLHDVVEDTPVTVEALADAFGEDMARWVSLLSDEPAPNRKARKEASHRKLAAIDGSGPDAIALIVKAADRLANMRQCTADRNERLLGMYLREYPAFRQATYRPQLADELWRELEELTA